MRDKCSMRKTILSAAALIGFVWTQNCFCAQTATAQMLETAPIASDPVSLETDVENKTSRSNGDAKGAGSNADVDFNSDGNESRSGMPTDVYSFRPEGLDEPQEQTPESERPKPIYKYIGNSFSFKFHRPSCPFAKAMWRGHVLRFQYRKQAIDAGQKPCRYCLPPYWKSVGAKILKQEPESKQGLSTVENSQNLPTVNSPKKDVKSPAEKDYTGN